MKELLLIPINICIYGGAALLGLALKMLFQWHLYQDRAVWLIVDAAFLFVIGAYAYRRRSRI